MLRDFVQFQHRTVDLGNALGLFARGQANMTDQTVHGRGGIDHLCNRLARGLHLTRTTFHLAARSANEGADFTRCSSTVLRQCAHLARHHGKALALLACARGFHGRVECQDVGLKGNAFDGRDDLPHLP